MLISLWSVAWTLGKFFFSKICLKCVYWQEYSIWVELSSNSRFLSITEVFLPEFHQKKKLNPWNKIGLPFARSSRFRLKIYRFQIWFLRTFLINFRKSTRFSWFVNFHGVIQILRDSVVKTGDFGSNTLQENIYISFIINSLNFLKIFQFEKHFSCLNTCRLTNFTP